MRRHAPPKRVIFGDFFWEKKWKIRQKFEAVSPKKEKKKVSPVSPEG
jgi:hypothetical protein